MTVRSRQESVLESASSFLISSQTVKWSATEMIGSRELLRPMSLKPIETVGTLWEDTDLAALRLVLLPEI